MKLLQEVESSTVVELFMYYNGFAIIKLTIMDQNRYFCISQDSLVIIIQVFHANSFLVICLNY